MYQAIANVRICAKRCGPQGATLQKEMMWMVRNGTNSSAKITFQS